MEDFDDELGSLIIVTASHFCDAINFFAYRGSSFYSYPRRCCWWCHWTEDQNSHHHWQTTLIINERPWTLQPEAYIHEDSSVMQSTSLLRHL